MKTYTLAEAMSKGRSMNLNLLRFIAALCVIVSHAFPLARGGEYSDFVTQFSSGELGLGGIAVGVFFLSSGLLVSKSVERNSSAQNYFRARCIRIFPPLLLTVGVCALILGPILTSKGILDYFLDLSFYTYLFNVILIPIRNLPGVFEGNVYGTVINGALWTLPVEFVCYIGLFVAYKIGLLNKKSLKIVTPLAALLFLLCFYVPIPIIQSMNIYLLPVFMFYVGILCYVYRDKIVLNNGIAILMIPIWFILVYLGFAQIAMITLFPYLLLVTIYHKKQCNSKLASLGNYSYGIYLCGFPIQQIIVHFYGGKMDVLSNICIAIPFACVVGILIFMIAEKPLLHK